MRFKPLLTVCTVWLCCVLCCVPCALSLICDHDGVFGVPYLALPCATLLMLCLSPAVLCAVSPMLCMSSPCMPEVVVGNGHTPADLSQIGVLTNAYQRGRPNQKPCGLACGTPYQTLPSSCARGAKPIGAFGLVPEPLPTLTTAPIWLCPAIVYYYQSLPAW